MRCSNQQCDKWFDHNSSYPVTEVLAFGLVVCFRSILSKFRSSNSAEEVSFFSHPHLPQPVLTESCYQKTTSPSDSDDECVLPSNIDDVSLSSNTDDDRLSHSNTDNDCVLPISCDDEGSDVEKVAQRNNISTVLDVVCDIPSLRRRRQRVVYDNTDSSQDGA